MSLPLLALLLVPCWPVSAREGPVATTGDPAAVESLKEANRILEEEIKLASYPQVYVVLNLSTSVTHLKSRGLELHQLPILAGCVSGAGSWFGVHRLLARPEVSRPKASPDPSLEPISLDDMPGEYALQFDSGLLLMVAPPAREQPWLWFWSRIREWWIRVVSRPAGPVVRVTLSHDAARSLAWSVIDGMPFLFSRAVEP